MDYVQEFDLRCGYLGEPRVVQRDGDRAQQGRPVEHSLLIHHNHLKIEIINYSKFKTDNPNIFFLYNSKVKIKTIKSNERFCDFLFERQGTPSESDTFS